MKRKRGPKSGYKKGKKNTKPVVNAEPVPVNTDDVVCSDEADVGQFNNEMGTDQASPGSENVVHISNEVSDPPTNTATARPGHRRFKVKLKTSKASEQQSQSDAQTQSDTDKSNPQVAFEKFDKAINKRENDLYSGEQTSELPKTIVGKSPKKAGSIKIKSSRGLGFPCEAAQGKQIREINTQKVAGDRVSGLANDEKTTDASLPRNMRGKKELGLRTCYNQKELSAALAVIKKVMKMDAAGPFNAPVDTVALGIPDYFDIIDTPMDFGTIHYDLEHGHKYMNSEDVYKDVRYIWDNCCKYNNKGDYIIDLMKRVKKNFMKYWTEAGLYSDIMGSGAAGSNLVEGTSGQGKLDQKGKPKHKRRRLGIDHHKSDCLCAVCVMRRRRKEHQVDSVVVDNQTVPSEGSLSRENKLEEGSPTNNLYGGNALSSLDHSMETDANADVEEVEHVEQPGKQDAVELQLNASGSSESSKQLSLENGIQYSDEQLQEREPQLRQLNDLKDNADIRQGIVHDHKETVKDQREQQLEENHSVLQICTSLFSSNLKSVWNGPHSLSRRHARPVQDNLIGATMAAFLKH